MRRLYLLPLLSCSLLSTSIPSFADPVSPAHFYVAIDAGIFQGNYNLSDTDTSNPVPSIAAGNADQSGYTAGLALGYRWMLSDKYFLGTELSGSVDSENARFANSSTNIDTSIAEKHHVDLTVDPGMRLGSDVFAYLKLGVTDAYLTDTTTAPVGLYANDQATITNQNRLGWVLGLGASKPISANCLAFAEYTYHDYGQFNLPDIQSMSTNYSRSARLNTGLITLGVSYQFA